jgi:hypothetical protein
MTARRAPVGDRRRQWCGVGGGGKAAAKSHGRKPGQRSGASGSAEAASAMTGGASGGIARESFESGYGTFKSNYGGTEVVSDSTAPDGAHSLRFNFTADWPAGNAPDIVGHPGLLDQEEVYIQYHVKYSSNWVDEPLTNKMVYIWFGDQGKDKPNLPVMGHSQWDANGVWAVLQASTVIPQQVWHRYDYSPGFDFTYGDWHRIVLHIEINTPGVSDGILQMWVDDALVIDATNGYFRNADQSSVGVTHLDLTPVYGGGCCVIAAMWFDDIDMTGPFERSRL